MSFPKYEVYKDSGVEWLGKVPEHWKIAPLKHNSTCNDQTLSDTTPEDYELEYVEISDVDAVIGIRGTTNYKFSNAPSRARRVVQDGDVLISTVRTYLRAITPVVNPPSNLIASTGFAVIRPRANGLHGGYLGYLLKAEWWIAEIISQSVGVSYPAINASDLVGIKVPVPEASEQVQIARFLDHETARIDALIAEQQRLIELLKEKRQAVISHAVTKGLDAIAPMKNSGVEWLGEVPAHWTVCRVKNVASFITSGPRGWSDYIDESATDVFLQSGDLDDQLNVNFKDAKRINSPEGAEGVRTRICNNDVLVCITGANTGRVAVVSAVGETAYVNQHLGLIRPITSKCYSRYLGYSLSSTACQMYFGVEQYGLKGGLSLTDIADAPLALPPLSEQGQLIAQIERQVAKLDKLEVDADMTITLLQERRSALISAAVTGKIDVRGWQAPASAAPATTLEPTHG